MKKTNQFEPTVRQGRLAGNPAIERGGCIEKDEGKDKREGQSTDCTYYTKSHTYSLLY